jgi:hypothetical protein
MVSGEDFQVRQLTSMQTESRQCRTRVKGSSYMSIEVSKIFA